MPVTDATLKALIEYLLDTRARTQAGDQWVPNGNTKLGVVPISGRELTLSFITDDIPDRAPSDFVPGSGEAWRPNDGGQIIGEIEYGGAGHVLWQPIRWALLHAMVELERVSGLNIEFGEDNVAADINYFINEEYFFKMSAGQTHVDEDFEVAVNNFSIISFNSNYGDRCVNP